MIHRSEGFASRKTTSDTPYLNITILDCQRHGMPFQRCTGFAVEGIRL
jgi:hypothetical protein